jgi:hypothetical protein
VKRALTILGTVLAVTASLATAGQPASGNTGTSADARTIVPDVMLLGPDNTCTAEAQAAWDAAVNPPIYVSNCGDLSSVSPETTAYLSLLTATANKQGYNTVTCSYGTSNWWDGYANGNSEWTADGLFDAYVQGSDSALGVSANEKASSARAETGMYLRASPNWPSPSSVTVDFRWAGIAYLQADADFSALAGTGQSNSDATYMIDGELWEDSLSATQHFYTKTIKASPTKPSVTSNPHVRWDDHGVTTPPTMRVPVQANDVLTSKIVGMMNDHAIPAIGANASAGVDSWNRGDTYSTGSQHWTFTMPKPYTLRDCGGDGVKQ